MNSWNRPPIETRWKYDEAGFGYSSEGSTWAQRTTQYTDLLGLMVLGGRFQMKLRALHSVGNILQGSFLHTLG